MTEFGIVKLHEMLKNGEITSRDLINESLKKSHELNEKCNAFVLKIIIQLKIFCQLVHLIL